MPHYDFRTPRVYLDAPLAAGQAVAFDRAQANYLHNVLRLGHGDALLLFNGRDGEWQAELAGAGKRALTAVVGERSARAAARPRPAFPVRPAQACPARLPGAEGGGNGRLAPAAGAHPAHPGGARQSRAHARQCDRGGAAVRHSDLAEVADPVAFQARDRRCRPPAGVLRRGRRGEGPGGGVGGGGGGQAGAQRAC